MTGPRSAEAGYSLVALMAGLTIMMILMGAATPFWRYVAQDMREEELIFRGTQIAEAIERFQKKNGNAYPPSLEILVKGKYLRKEYKDPMVAEGKWRLLRPGEVPVGVPGPVPGSAAAEQSRGLTPPPAVPRLPGSEATVAGHLGPIAGVVSTSSLKSFRRFNNREKYNEWAFIAGQPRIVGDVTAAIPGFGIPPQPRPSGIARPPGMPTPPSLPRQPGNQ